MATRTTLLVLMASWLAHTHAMANNVLDMNPPSANAHLTVQGSDWLWAVFAVMASTALGITLWAHFTPRKSFQTVSLQPSIPQEA